MRDHRARAPTSSSSNACCGTRWWSRAASTPATSMRTSTRSCRATTALPHPALWAAATASLLEEEARMPREAQAGADRWSPWARADAWRLGHPGKRIECLAWREHKLELAAHGHSGNYRLDLGDRARADRGRAPRRRAPGVERGRQPAPLAGLGRCRGGDRARRRAALALRPAAPVRLRGRGRERQRPLERAHARPHRSGEDRGRAPRWPQARSCW